MTGDTERIRELVLQTARNSNGPTHLGGSLSSIEILSVLFSRVMTLESNEDSNNAEQDLFILSKGHCYLALLATLCEAGRLDLSALDHYQSDQGPFGAHPIMGQTRDVISSNGSLGHGLGFGLGIAFQKKMDNQPGSVYVLMGDGECGEGSVYEAALMAPSLGVSALVAIIDANSFGNDGDLPFVNIDKVSKAFGAFGWQVENVDGHSEEELTQAFSVPHTGKPMLIVAHTTKGKGLGGLEGSNESHHMKLIHTHVETEH